MKNILKNFRKVGILVCLVVMLFSFTACTSTVSVEDYNALTQRVEQLEGQVKELEKETAVGKFFTLEKAYDKGWLTREDLMSIAYYHHQNEVRDGRKFNEGIMGEDYTPLPKNPEELSEEMDLEIRQAYWDTHYKIKNSNDITVDDIGIGNSYYGIYKNCIAIMIWVTGPYGGWEVYETVAGVEFYCSLNNRIEIYIYK